MGPNEAAMLTFDQLATLRTIAAAGSFSRAAEQLFLTQSALSQRVKHLEQSLGVELFDRRTKGLKLGLTAAGERVLRFAHEAHELYASLERDLHLDENAGVRETVTIASAVTVSQYVLPHVLSTFYHRCPDVRVRIVQCVGQEVEDRVLTGAADLGIRAGSTFPAGLRATHLTTDPVVMVARPGHPLLHTRRVDRAAISGYPIALPPVGTFLRDLLDRWMASVNLQLDVAVEAISPDAIKEAAIHGPGLAIAFGCTLTQELRDGTLRVVSVPSIACSRRSEHRGRRQSKHCSRWRAPGVGYPPRLRMTLMRPMHGYILGPSNESRNEYAIAAFAMSCLGLQALRSGSPFGDHEKSGRRRA
jgi:DNA-binding transcriptional LysR family regulator